MSRHIPVLIKEVLEGLNLKAGKNVVDCTLGDGGHAEAILEATAPDGKLLGIDADAESVLRAKRFLYRFGERAQFVCDNFANLKNILTDYGFGPVDGIFFDLGWSTPQFKERGRGFSFDPPNGEDEPLDMRFGKSELTAADILNNYSREELNKVFKNYGEEKLSSEIAGAVVKTRKLTPLTTVRQFSEIVLQVYREKLNSAKDVPWVGGIHPATKVFQALRVEVNRELEILKNILPTALEAFGAGGRLAVITFHSLEDRIVKQYFKSQENKTLKLINKKPIVAREEEFKTNPSARSAKLRIVEKI